MPVTVSKSGPGLAKIAADLKRLQKADVLVGIPADRAMRKGDAMNNATLAFIQSKGSEIAHIPPRPFLEPSIKANQKIIAPPLAAAAQAILQSKPEAALNHLKRAGVIASNGAKRWFTSPENNWKPNAPSTIAQKGSDRPLIDKAALRRSVTYCVRDDGAVKIEGTLESIGEGIVTLLEEGGEEAVESV